MSLLWHGDLPAERHSLSCPVWTTHYGECDCGAVDDEDPRHVLAPLPDTAARLDALYPLDETDGAA